MISPRSITIQRCLLSLLRFSILDSPANTVGKKNKSLKNTAFIHSHIFGYIEKPKESPNRKHQETKIFMDKFNEKCAKSFL